MNPDEQACSTSIYHSLDVVPEEIEALEASIPYLDLFVVETAKSYLDQLFFMVQVRETDGTPIFRDHPHPQQECVSIVE